MMQREADGTGAKEMRSKRMMDGRTDNWSVNKVAEELKKHVTRISTHLLKVTVIDTNTNKTLACTFYTFLGL